MRTTTAAWAAAIAVMSMRGPFTTAEAAPARQADQQRHAPVFPRVMKRQSLNTTTSSVATSQNGLPLSIPLSSALDGTSPIPSITGELPPPTATPSSDSDPPDTSTNTSIPLDSTQPPSAGKASTAHVSAIPLFSADQPDSGTTTPLPALTTSLSVPLVQSGGSPASLGYNTPIKPGHAAAGNSGVAPPPPNSLHPTGQVPPGTGAIPTTASNGGLLGGAVPNVAQSLPTSTLLASNPLAPLVGGTGTKPSGEAAPTPRPNVAHGPISSADSTTGNIIVGLTSAFTNLPDSSAGTPHGRVKQTDSGLLGGVGVTGVPTGSLLSNVLPTQTSAKTGGGGILPLPETTNVPALSHLNGGLGGVTSALSQGVGGVGTAVSQLTGTGKGHGLPGAVSGVQSDVTHVVPTGVTSALTGAVGGVGSVVSQVTGTGKGHGLPGVVSGVKSAVTHVVPTGVTSALTGAVGGVGSVVSGAKSDVTHAIPAGVTHALPTGVPLTGTGKGHGAGIVPAVLSSVQSEVSGVGAVTTGLANHPVSALQSSLDSKLSGIAATATDPAVVSSLQSGFSSILTSAASGLSQPTAPVGSALSGVTNGLPTPPNSAFTFTAAGTTVVVPIPTTGAPSGGSAGFNPTNPNPFATSTKSSDGTAGTTGTDTNTASKATETGDSANSTVTTVAAGGHSTTSSTTGSNAANATEAATATSTEKTKHAGPKVSIRPTGTDSDTSMTLPTTWTFAPNTLSGTASANALTMATSGSTSASTAFPTAIPQLVQPPEGMPLPPVNSTLIQVGFSFGLNYEFVVKERKSAPEIFLYLPQGIAYGLGISKEDIKMNALLPYDTSATVGYITTLAQAYIPSQYVNQLQADLHTPSASIYFNPDLPVKTLMDMINPSIAILPGAVTEYGAAFSAPPNAAAPGGAGVGRGAPIGGDAGNSSTVKTSSVGIGIGAVGGAAVYAAAMVYIARRYRKNRKSHQRASSVPTAGEMAQRPGGGGMGTFFMSGANGRGSTRNSATQNGGRNSRTSNGSSNGRSVREQGISAPLMSENSLGWN